MRINKITSRMKKGTIIVEVEGFFVERFLNICKSKNVEINDIKYRNNGIIVFKTSSNKYGEIKKVAEKVKCKVKIKNYELFEQVTNNNQSNQNKHEEDEENEVTFDDIINKIF